MTIGSMDRETRQKRTARTQGLELGSGVHLLVMEGACVCAPTYRNTHVVQIGYGGGIVTVLELKVVRNGGRGKNDRNNRPGGMGYKLQGNQNLDDK